MKETEETDESYAMVSFSRTSGTRRKLFGSHLSDHSSTIFLEITEARMIHGLGETRYHSGDNIVRVEMSAAQFASLLTNMNTQGVPCTLQRLQGRHIQPPPESSTEQERVREDFSHNVNRMGERLRESINVVNGKLEQSSISKKDMREVLTLLKKAEQDYSSNLPFILEQFTQAAGRVVTDAKAEVDAFLSNVLTNMGMTALKEKMSSHMLGFDDKDKE